MLLLIFYTAGISQQTLNVVINESDVEQLGGWPLNRKWFAIALQNLNTAGANRIYVDLDFSKPDIYHPESDILLKDILSKNENIYTQSFDTSFGKTFVSSINGFIFSNDEIQIDELEEEHLMVHLLGNIDLPISIISTKNDTTHQISFSEVLKGDIDAQLLKNSNVIISTNIEGITSYISINNNVFTPSELFLIIASKIQSGDYLKTLNTWIYICLLIASCSLLLKFRKFNFIILATFLTLCASLYLFKYNVPLWLSSLLIYEAFLYFIFQSKRSDVKIVEQAAEHNNVETDDLKSERDNLKAKLRYYEDISETTEVELSENDRPIYHQDSPFKKVLSDAKKIASSKLSVIINGESGTGKEEVAIYIHENSDRSNLPFIAVNCGALSTNLLESELFGHEAGAFTGAVKQKIGRFEQANNGTIFLDEIGEISPEFQVKLLRVLQEGEFERVGGTKTIKVDVRIITATHKNLTNLIKEDFFREDLYYRLNGYTITIPPLRKRKMDVPLLITKILNDSGTSLQVSDQLFSELKEYEWKGNIRELISATERAVINAKHVERTVLLPKDFQIGLSRAASDSQAEKILELFREKEFTHKMVSIVSDELSIHRVTVTEYLRGWVIKYLSENKDKMHVCTKLTNMEECSESIEKRIIGYITKIEEKINDGIENQLDNETIKLKHFKSLPKFFDSYFERLVNKMRA